MHECLRLGTAFILFFTLAAGAGPREVAEELSKNSAEIILDLMSRFDKCPGDLAELEARGKKCEIPPRPYPLIDSQILILRDELNSFIKSYDDSEFEPRSAEWLLRRIVWRSQILDEIIKDLAKGAKQSASYRSWRENSKRFEKQASAIFEVDLASAAEKKRSSGWTLHYDTFELEKAVAKSGLAKHKNALIASDFKAAEEPLNRAKKELSTVKQLSDYHRVLRDVRFATLLIKDWTTWLTNRAMEPAGEDSNDKYSHLLGRGDYLSSAREKFIKP